MRTVTENNTKKALADLKSVHTFMGQPFGLTNILIPYSSDWNYLMEVVIKCRGMQLDNINKIVDIYDALHNTDIKAVYSAVVSFIEWYNSAEKQNNNQKTKTA